MGDQQISTFTLSENRSRQWRSDTPNSVSFSLKRSGMVLNMRKSHSVIAHLAILMHTHIIFVDLTYTSGTTSLSAPPSGVCKVLDTSKSS